MQRLNKVKLSGRAGEIVFSHEHYGRYYYKFMLTVIRKSGAVDMFPIVIEDSIVRDNDYNGKEIVVTGSIRSMDIQISTTTLIISQLTRWKSWKNRFRKVI